MSINIKISYLKSDPNLNNWVEKFSNALNITFKSISDSKFKINDGVIDSNKNDFEILILTKEDDNTKLESINKIKKSDDRLMQIHLDAIDFGNLPSILLNAPIFAFYDYNSNTKNSVWSSLAPLKNNDESWQKTLDIASNILRKEENNGKTIFLAYTSIDQVKNREKIRRDLINSGFKVIPTTPFKSLSPEKLKTEVIDNLKKSALSIHILGGEKSEFIADSDDLITYQNKIAAEYSEKNNLKRIIWIQPELKTSTDQLKKIEILKRNHKLLVGAEIVKVHIEILKSIIYDKIDSISKPNKLIEKGVYFIKDPADSYNQNIIKEKLKAKNINVFEIDTNKPLAIKEHKHLLVNSDGVLLFYGGKNSNWINSMFDDIIKSPAYGRTKDFKALGLISKTKLELKAETKRFNLIEMKEENISVELETFVKKLTT